MRGMTATMPRLHCISADSHVTEPPGTYLDRIDPAFRDRAPRLVQHEVIGASMLIDNGQSMVPYWLVAAAGRPADEVRLEGQHTFEELHRGGWDPEARLADQDRDGVDAEVIYPSVGMLLCNHPDAAYQRACFNAYNEWVAEFCAYAPDRLIGLGQTALRTPEEGIADLDAIKALGLRGVMLPGVPPLASDGHDYDDPMWDDFWEAVIESALPPSFHILTSRSDTPFSPNIRGPKLNNFMAIMRGNQDIIGTLVFGAVFERHPRLHVVCVEADAGWVPHYMYRADHAYDRHRNWLTAGELSKRPSDYIRENVYLTFQDDWVAFETAHLMNVERLLWASDFPHSDATWPNSQALLTEHTSQLSGHDRARILHDNTAALYGLIA
jgi:predicted TIM-barrel fold metal-dependent hydrolase